MFTEPAIVPIILEGTRLHIGVLIALAVAVAAWVLMARTIIGFEIKVVGQAPARRPLRRLRPQEHHLALPAARRRPRRPRRH